VSAHLSAAQIKARLDHPIADGHWIEYGPVFTEELRRFGSEHPAVLMSAAVGVPHPEWGEAVHAEVILREAMTASADELIDHVKARLGSYKAPKTTTLCN
jgi:acyl-CoA synthetase (AMP-forming)/AMP-acid ligase II